MDRCVHYGEPRKRGKGIRPTQHHFALKCPAKLYVSYNHHIEKFEVRKCNLDHCHPIGPDIMPHYPFKRRVVGDELKEIEDLISLAPKLKLVRQYILKKIGKQVILKDIQNVLRFKLWLAVMRHRLQSTDLKRKCKEIRVVKEA